LISIINLFLLICTRLSVDIYAFIYNCIFGTGKSFINQFDFGAR